MRTLTALVLAAGLGLAAHQSVLAAGHGGGMSKVLEGDHRTAEHKARDAYRHPAKTLAFFGMEPSMAVVEIWPGGRGYYTEILGPALRDEGQLTVAIFGDETDQFRDFMLKANDNLAAKIEASPNVYGKVQKTMLWPPGQVEIAPAGSQDMVLTFRNLHNWMKWEQTDDVLAAIHTALKPNGILGVTDHRLPADREIDPRADAGYVNQQDAIRMIEAAGFKLVAASEINANAKDTADHPRGVWTLPPTYAMGDEDREKYAAIGESDRFTLKFRKVGR